MFFVNTEKYSWSCIAISLDGAITSACGKSLSSSGLTVFGQLESWLSIKSDKASDFPVPFFDLAMIF